MAHGDVRPTVSHSGRGSWGRSSTVQYYDDEGRGKSQDLWIWFQQYYHDGNDTIEHLLEMPVDKAYQCVKYSVSRFSILDICDTYNPETDSRARRMIVKDHDVESWNKVWAYLNASYAAHVDKVEKERKNAAEKAEGEHAAYEALRKAEAAKVEREDELYMASTAQLTIGQFESELAQMSAPHDRSTYGGGDYVEDVVEVLQTGNGWMEESTKTVGTKLQITLSLDLSNSMLYNGLAEVAAESFRDLGWMLKTLAFENNDLKVGFFVFSLDDGYTPGYYGKRAKRLLEKGYWGDDHSKFGEFKDLVPSKMREDSRFFRQLFDGQDTYVSPLFAEIEKWEREDGDPGAVRLDLIITDAVLEHPKDIRDADVIQERRNGNMQSVMLNFMPEQDWLGSTLPRRTFMTKVDKENLNGLLRQILSDFIGAHI
jgi:hypothetical protein